MACYFMIICMPYDVLYIIWVLNDNTKKSTIHAPVWPLDVCCETSILSTFVLADTDKIEYRLRQVVNLPWTGVQPRGSLMTFIQLALRKPEIKQRLSLVREKEWKYLRKYVQQSWLPLHRTWNDLVVL